MAFDVQGADGLDLWQLGALAIAALNRPGLSQIPPKQTLIPPPLDDTSQCLNYARGLSPLKDAGNDPNAAQLGLLQLISTQTSMQGNPMVHSAITAILLGLESAAASLHNPDLDELFAKEYGCSARQWNAVAMMLWHSAQKADASRLDQLTQNFSTTNVSATSLKKIVSKLSRSVADVHNAITTELSAYRGGAIVQKFFSDTPLLAINDEEWLFAPHPYLRSLATRGVFFEAMRLARNGATDEGKPNSQNNAHTNALGKRFADFVQHSFEASPKSNKVFGDHEYQKNSNNRSADLILLEDDERNVLLMECKVARLGAGAFYGYDYDDFNASAKQVAQALIQSVNYARNAEACIAKGNAREDCLHVTKAVANARKFFFVVSFPMFPAILCVDHFRNAVSTEIDLLLGKEAKRWVDFRLKKIDWLAVDYEALDAYLSSDTRQTLFGVGKRFTESKSFGKIEAGVGGLKNFIFERYNSDSFPTHQVRAIHERFFNSVGFSLRSTASIAGSE